ncbi:MAG: SDR family NAD(P)-dependent oxidoreductase [Polyangiales bacterium]
MKQQKFALVTGAAGGLGAATVQELVTNGWFVFAADLADAAQAPRTDAPNIFRVTMDVCDRESIDHAFTEVSDRTKSLDAVVNFAGIHALASMIEIDEADFKRVMDINLFGTFRVNQRFFELLHAAKGRIVNISSETGWQSAGPFNGPYAISKHAIEAYSDALRRELALLDVSVIKVQPGPFRTSMVKGLGETFERAANKSRYFRHVLMGVQPLAAREAESAAPAVVLAKAVVAALQSNRPRAAYSVRPNRMRAALDSLPTPIVDRIWNTTLRRLGKQK